MFLYDICCSYCEGIFECFIFFQGLYGQICCFYCKEEMVVLFMFMGGYVGLQVKYCWQLCNGVE